jgi:hypothetical protein
MQPLLPQLVSHRSNGAHPHSLRRFAASSVVLALLLVAAVALSSSSVSSSLEAHVDALPTDAQMKSAEAPVSQASPASHASHLKRCATLCNPTQSHKSSTAFVLFSDEQRPPTIAPHQVQQFLTPRLPRRLSPKTIVSEGSAYVNAFSGRGSIGKRSHEDFGKITMEMIKKLDKELPSIRSLMLL